MNRFTTRVADNLAAVGERIRAAATAAGRAPEEVKLVAVTKYVELPVIEALIDAGCRVFGESRPQELWRKSAAIERDDIEWHLVGHLQRNKIRRTLPLVSLVHSLDNERLAVAIDLASGDLNQQSPMLLEVNVSGDKAKHGFDPNEVEGALSRLSKLPNLKIQGLMTMASREGGSDRARTDFANLRELRDRLRGNCPDSVTLDELSIGMSGDFEVAIAEGATIVRVGSALYQGLDL